MKDSPTDFGSDTLAGAEQESPTPVEQHPQPEQPPEDEKSVDDLATLYNEGSPPKPPSSTSPTDEEHGGEEELNGKMTFLEHLDEFRRRIIYSAIAIFVSMAGCWVFREQIFDFLAVPIKDVVPHLVFTKPTEPFTIFLKVSFVAGVFLAAPVVLVQVWLFIAPGLYRREKMYAIPFLISSTLLFLLGGAFAYYVVLPTALRFLILEFGKKFQAMVSAIEYFNFETIIIVGMGLIFQMPVLAAFLSLFGLLTPRFLWKNFRYAFLLIVIVAAVVSPTADALNLFLWSGPMIILYIISIGISWIFKRRREAKWSRGD